MKEFGMELLFVSREAYTFKKQLADKYLLEHDDFYYVPKEGRVNLELKVLQKLVCSRLDTRILFVL